MNVAAARVLLLESDEKIAALVQHLLHREGYTVERGQGGGGAAVELCKTRVFDVIIIDVSIAESTLEPGSRRGIGVLHALERECPDVLDQTIVTTALPDRDLRDVPNGCRIIRKPFDIDALRSAVAERSLAHTIDH